MALLAPVEGTGFYLTLRPMIVGNLKAEQIPQDNLAAWYPWICVGLAFFVRAWATRASDSWMRVQWPAVAIAVIAFILWIMTMGHYIADLSEIPVLSDTRVTGLVGAVFTFIIPYFYRGDPPPRPSVNIMTER